MDGRLLRVDSRVVLAGGRLVRVDIRLVLVGVRLVRVDGRLVLAGGRLVLAGGRMLRVDSMIMVHVLLPNARLVWAHGQWLKSYCEGLWCLWWVSVYLCVCVPVL